MHCLRTPEHRFHDLLGFPFAPHYLDVDDTEGGALRLHYVDEGPRDADPVVMMHGSPSWGYLFRAFIDPCVAAGYRVVVPDLAGFGQSDKPSQASDYTCERHFRWMYALFKHLSLKHITLFCHDWGTVFGLRILAEHPHWFERALVCNPILPRGYTEISNDLMNWRNFTREVPVYPTSGVISMGTQNKLNPVILRAYDAPFPEESYKEGARVFPWLMPDSPDHPTAKLNQNTFEALTAWRKPLLTVFGESDPVTQGVGGFFTEHFPGCEGQPHTVLKDAAHFIHEDQAETLTAMLLRFIANNPR